MNRLLHRRQARVPRCSASPGNGRRSADCSSTPARRPHLAEHHFRRGHTTGFPQIGHCPTIVPFFMASPFHPSTGSHTVTENVPGPLTSMASTTSIPSAR